MHYQELLTTGEASERLGVSRQTVRRMVDNGFMRPEAMVKVTQHGSYVFTPAEVERVAALRSKKAEAAK